MHQGYNLELAPKTPFPRGSYERGQEVHAKHKANVESTLAAFALNNGSLDASRMQASWFPHVRADVFISHSHKDTELATCLAGWMYQEFKLTAFVDSCVWGYGDELLREIDNEYCYYPATNTYSYEKRNKSTSHVHMMLSVALSQMIDACECVIFLNTPSSIVPSDVIGAGTATMSPWLYSELAMTRG